MRQRRVNTCKVKSREYTKPRSLHESDKRFRSMQRRHGFQGSLPISFAQSTQSPLARTIQPDYRLRFRKVKRQNHPRSPTRSNSGIKPLQEASLNPPLQTRSLCEAQKSKVDFTLLPIPISLACSRFSSGTLSAHGCSRPFLLPCS